MLTVPNQLETVVVKDNRDDVFLKVNKSNLQYAFKQSLSPAALKLWLWVISNSDGFKYIWSPAMLAKELGISADRIRHVRKELEEKGFLVDGKIYERPPKVEQELRDKKAKVLSQTGIMSDLCDKKVISPPSTSLPSKTDRAKYHLSDYT